MANSRLPLPLTGAGSTSRISAIHVADSKSFLLTHVAGCWQEDSFACSMWQAVNGGDATSRCDQYRLAFAAIYEHVARRPEQVRHPGYPTDTSLCAHRRAGRRYNEVLAGLGREADSKSSAGCRTADGGE